MTIVLVPVVRCKDCLHFLPQPFTDGGTCIKDNSQRFVPNNFFCADGETNDGWDYEEEQT